MNFNEHYHLAGKHAYLSPSQNAWLNYSEEKLNVSYQNSKAREEGTKLHELASDLINLNVSLPKNNKTLNAFVNDAIGFRMASEVVLYYSDFCFGTADAISFGNKLLRIHDLKTGFTPVNMNQLMVYAALFCLEYKVDPKEIKYELRIYQLDDVTVFEPNGVEVFAIMQRIIDSDRILAMREGGL